ncbi:hypothetical protein BJY04DRAFT_198688 [Aspergillus karnatakaensis]|uniref:GPI anchored serine-threonine rich protein n=1 Tax=Aspergillus karnatakaensis TaxID=1810916 RepID=UPI003CCD13FF
MRFLSLTLLATVSVSVFAQDVETSTTTTATTQQTTSSCGAQYILDACIQTIQSQVDACGPNEWDCLCEQANNMLTCYNNCPGDPGRTAVQQQRDSYCNAAGITSTSTTSTTATSTRTSSSTSTETEATTTSEGAAAETEDVDDAGVKLNVGLGVGGGVVLAVLGGLVW